MIVQFVLTATPRPIFAVMNDKDCAVFAREHFAEEFGEENVIIPEPYGI